MNAKAFAVLTLPCLESLLLTLRQCSTKSEALTWSGWTA
jgi:hypothetical protein